MCSNSSSCVVDHNILPQTSFTAYDSSFRRCRFLPKLDRQNQSASAFAAVYKNILPEERPALDQNRSGSRLSYVLSLVWRDSSFCRSNAFSPDVSSSTKSL